MTCPVIPRNRDDKQFEPGVMRGWRASLAVVLVRSPGTLRGPARLSPARAGWRRHFGSMRKTTRALRC